METRKYRCRTVGGWMPSRPEGKRAVEVERSGERARLRRAAERLRDAPTATQQVLQVPEKDMDAASEAMRKAGVSGTVKNLGGTKRRTVR
jgi:hypothetical protein